MKKIIILIFSGVFAIQIPQIITLKDYYCGKGVIFNKESKYPFVDSKYKESYTPNLNQVRRAEDLFFSKYYEYKKSVLDSFNSNYKLGQKYKESKNVKKKFNKYYRQYAGYIDTNNDSIMYIGLFNFSNKKKASHHFKNWNKILFLGSGEYYEENQEFYLININKNKLIFK